MSRGFQAGGAAERGALKTNGCGGAVLMGPRRGGLETATVKGFGDCQKVPHKARPGQVSELWASMCCL